MSFQQAALAQVVLEGVPLPAKRARLLEYARRQDGGERVAGLLSKLPDREYASIDEVGEALASVQPQPEPGQPHEPKPESGLPPGGDAYTDPSEEPGRVREHGPSG
jgi:uncharacterized protein DUF2795